MSSLGWNTLLVCEGSSSTSAATRRATCSRMRPTTRPSGMTSRRSIRTRSLSTVSWLAGRHCSTGTFRSRSFRRLSGTLPHVSCGALTVRDKAQATRDYLLANYEYSLNPTATSIEDFVVNRHSGYCERFATSMVLLLRAQGVRALLVSGFVATEWNNCLLYTSPSPRD